MVMGKKLKVIKIGIKFKIIVVKNGELIKKKEVKIEVEVVECVGWKVNLLVKGNWNKNKTI
jgi:hypothetical protein